MTSEGTNMAKNISISIEISPGNQPLWQGNGKSGPGNVPGGPGNGVTSYVT